MMSEPQLTETDSPCAWAISSVTVVMGNRASTARNNGSVATMATGWKSRSGSYGAGSGEIDLIKLDDGVGRLGGHGGVRC